MATKRLRALARTLAQKYIPLTTRRKLAQLASWPPVGWVWFGNLRRLKPINEFWGMERGQPIDRYYIENFLARNKQDIHGRVLEIGDNQYTVRFGEDRVTKSDVLHIAEQRPNVTIIGDLTQADHILSATFDTIILTQVLNAIFDIPAVVQTVFRILKPGGMALVTVPGISKISRYDMDRWGYYWSFTTKSIRRLFETAFPSENIEVEAHGNVLATIAFLHGLAAEDLRKRELDHLDPDYELLITLKVTKPN